MSFKDGLGTCDRCGKESIPLKKYGSEYWCRFCITDQESIKKSAHHQKEIEEFKRFIARSRGE